MDGEPALRAQRATAELLRYNASCGSDVGILIASGSARCEQLDAAARLLMAGGWRSPARGTAPEIEGDLVATTTGLFYVVPRAGYVWFTPWSLLQVELGTMPTLPWGRAQVLVTAHRDQLVFRVAPRPAAREIAAVAADLIQHHGESEVLPEARHEEESAG